MRDPEHVSTARIRISERGSKSVAKIESYPQSRPYSNRAEVSDQRVRTTGGRGNVASRPAVKMVVCRDLASARLFYLNFVLRKAQLLARQPGAGRFHRKRGPWVVLTLTIYIQP